jgi:hypothetical protein
MLHLISIVTNNIDTICVFISSLWSIYTVGRRISDLSRVIYGSLSIEEIQRIKLCSIKKILYELVAILLMLLNPLN